MEQHTISISQADNQASFNARASILVAANPIAGLSNRLRTLKRNMTMSAPIMRSFDLFFVVVDDCTEASDLNIVHFIVNLHCSGASKQPSEFTQSLLQRYIRAARIINSVILPEEREVLVELYKKRRKIGFTGSGRSAYRITACQLESLIRLS